MATINRIADLFSYTSLSLLWHPHVSGDVILCNPFQSTVHGSHSVGGDCDDEGTTNVMTDTEFRDCIQSIYLPAGTPVDVAKITALYPNNPAQGSPFGTGSANQLLPQFKRISAFEGDYFFTGIR
ncbi:hypothetical protein B0H14DRAFT_3456051 [Mycena olivaceomarginata]|nr:hypothetical protein B0H14DRAFT_3456051 [Mycena olivaceomarginata]